MSQLSAFEQTGKSFTITVGVTSTVASVNLADIGLTQIPQALRFINNGTADVWVVMGNVNSLVAAFPVPAAANTGTPQAGFRVKPGATVDMRCNANDPTQKVPNNAATNVGPGFYLATISGTAAQALDVIPGEGI
jgi:hypothetical protein